MSSKFNLAEATEALGKWYKAIFVITIVVGIAGYIITIPQLDIVPPLYESQAVVYPANMSLLDRPYLFEGESVVSMDVQQFGGGFDSDRLVSIGRSRQISQYIVQNYNLIEHYDIDPNKTKHPMSSAMEKLKDRFSIYKNEYGAIEIIFIDKDNFLAADIVNDVIVKIDEINKSMIMESRQKTMQLLEEHINAKRKEIDNTMASLKEVDDEFQKKLLESQFLQATEQLMVYTNLYDQYKLITTDNISTVSIMESALPSEKRENSRMLIILAMMAATFISLMLIATLIQTIRRY